MKTLIFLIITLLGQALLGQTQPKSLAKDAQEILDELDQHLQLTKVQQLQVKEILLRSEKEDVINRKKAKLDIVLLSFLETDFMKRFKEMRWEAEALVATFKSYQDTFSPSEVNRVKKAYSVIADKYNLLLNEIKMDLLDRKKLKAIKDNPKMYSDALKNNLRELKEEYARHFERERLS